MMQLSFADVLMEFVSVAHPPLGRKGEVMGRVFSLTKRIARCRKAKEQKKRRKARTLKNKWSNFIAEKSASRVA